LINLKYSIFLVLLPMLKLLYMLYLRLPIKLRFQNFHKIIEQDYISQTFKNIIFEKEYPILSYLTVPETTGKQLCK
jgi:hypothetical protein